LELSLQHCDADEHVQDEERSLLRQRRLTGSEECDGGEDASVGVRGGGDSELAHGDVIVTEGIRR
jgi:hypothetical protein